MNTPACLHRNHFTLARRLVLLPALAVSALFAQEAPAPAAGSAPTATLPPVPAPMNVPKPGPVTDTPYAPQPILPGGIVIPLFPPGSPYLNMARVTEAEQYTMTNGAPGRIQSIVNIHNPSIEVHTVEKGTNTGAAVILCAGGAHTTLNVGTEAGDFVPYFYNYGVNTIILRNRLKSSGYNPLTDEIYDALQAIRLVRAHAKEWGIDPNKIGIMGFSAGAELAAPAAVQYDDFDKKNSSPDDPLAGITCRPDFVGLIYPGPTPFARDPNTPIPRNAPPTFIACAGSGDQQHAMWADEYFTAMLKASVPNIEMHIYGDGVHANGLKDRNGTPFGTWQDRFVDWFRDLGFLNKPGVETKASLDTKAVMNRPQRGGRGAGASGSGRGNRGGNRGAPANASTPPPAAT
jgi:endo-1,4-beta-xylanase